MKNLKMRKQILLNLVLVGSSLKLISKFSKKKLTYLELIALDFMLMKLKNVLLVNTIKITKDLE